MSEVVKRKNPWLTVLKVVLIIVGSLALIVVGAFCFFKYYLGIDLLQIKQSINLLNKPYSYESVVTDAYSDDDIVSGFYKMFGDNQIYTQQDGKYVFDKQEYETSTLLANANLTNKELAGIFNLYITEYGGESALGNSFKLSQIKLSNLTEDETSIHINSVVTFEINLLNTAEENSASFLLGFVPSTILISSNVTINISKENCFNFTLQNNGFTINNLSSTETNQILTTLKTLHMLNSTDDFINSFNTPIFSTLLGNDSATCFINSITGASSYQFVEDEQIYFEIKKV